MIVELGKPLAGARMQQFHGPVSAAVCQQIAPTGKGLADTVPGWRIRQAEIASRQYGVGTFTENTDYREKQGVLT